MSSPVESSLLAATSQDSETTELVSDPSLTFVSASSPSTSSPSNQYLTRSFSAEIIDTLKEKLADNTDGSPQPYSRFDFEDRSKQRLLRTRSEGSSSRMATSFEDVSSLRLWKGIVAEFVGTLLLTLVGCGSCMNLKGKENVTSPVVQISLCFGLSVATIVWSIGHISGGHINPAVSVAMLATRKISLAKAVFFILAQLLGAVVGAGILLGLTPKTYQGGMGVTSVNENLNTGQAIGVEFFVTFVLVFTVFASCDKKRKDLNGSVPLAIGLVVTMCHLWAIDFTGSSMNTARSFGPALINGKWENHWVYWLGPLLGGAVAGLLYEHLFAANASLLKAKACLLATDYDDDKYKGKKLKVRIIEEDSTNEENDDIPLTEKEKFTSKV